MADKHKYAKRCKKINFDLNPSMEDEDNYCKCCNMPIQGEDFEACAPVDDLKELGAGVVLYFLYLKYAIMMLCISFVTAGFWCWLDAYQTGNEVDWNLSEDESNFII